MKSVCTVAALSLVLACSGAVFGAVWEGQFSVSPMIGGYTHDGGQHLDSAPLYSLRGGYNFTDHVGVEAGLDYSITSSRLATDKDVAIFKYGVEGLYHFMPEKKLVPFVAAGFGGYNQSGPSALVSRKEMGFVSYGGGLKYSLYDRLALRADVRHIVANSSAFEYTVGVTIPFGGVANEERSADAIAAYKAAIAKKRQQEAEASRIAPQEPVAEEKPERKVVPQPPPAPPSAAAREESGTKELPQAERLAQLKEQFAKEESERIATFKAEWEKGREARQAAERAARSQEAPDQAPAGNYQYGRGEWNPPPETAGQAAKASVTGYKKKHVPTKKHKSGTKRKKRTPAAPR